MGPSLREKQNLLVKRLPCLGFIAQLNNLNHHRPGANDIRSETHLLFFIEQRLDLRIELTVLLYNNSFQSMKPQSDLARAIWHGNWLLRKRLKFCDRETYHDEMCREIEVCASKDYGDDGTPIYDPFEGRLSEGGVSSSSSHVWPGADQLSGFYSPGPVSHPLSFLTVVPCTRPGSPA